MLNCWLRETKLAVQLFFVVCGELMNAIFYKLLKKCIYTYFDSILMSLLYLGFLLPGTCWKWKCWHFCLMYQSCHKPKCLHIPILPVHTFTWLFLTSSVLPLSGSLSIGKTSTSCLSVVMWIVMQLRGYLPPEGKNVGRLHGTQTAGHPTVTSIKARSQVSICLYSS